MSTEKKEKIEKGANWVIKLAVTGMLGFISLVLQDVWSDWKDHQKEDQATEKMVVAHEQTLKEHTTSINFLTNKALSGK